MNRKETMLAYGAWIAICVLWGTTYLAIRIAVRTLPDAWMSGVRFLTAGGLMLVILRLRGKQLPAFRLWLPLAFVGITLVGLGNWMVVWSEKFVSSGTAALNVAAVPFWMAGMESIFKRRIERAGGTVEGWHIFKIAGLIVGFLGVILLLLPHLATEHSSNYFSGIIALQFGCFSWSIGSIYSKYKTPDSDPLMNASIEMLLGGIFLCIIAAVKGDFRTIHWTSASALAFGYLIVFGAMIGFVCFIYALSKLPSSTVSLYAYINPVIAVWLGWFVLDEQVGVTTIAATAVILFGIFLVRRRPAEAGGYFTRSARVEN